MKVVLSLFCLLLSTASMVWAMESRTIHDAVYNHNLAAIKQFVDHDQTLVNQKNNRGDAPLHLAARVSCCGCGCRLDEQIVEIARFLLDHGALVDVQDGCSRTPLDAAAWFGNEKIARLLLDHGASVNHQNKFGATPLHSAVRNGNLGIIKSLLEHGASSSVLDFQGKTPADYAPNNHRPEIVHLLQEWSQLLSQRSGAAKLAFCEVLHPRLGASSPANILSQPLLKEIFQHLQPEDFARTKSAPRSILTGRCAQISAAALLLAAAVGTWQLCHH